MPVIKLVVIAIAAFAPPCVNPLINASAPGLKFPAAVSAVGVNPNAPIEATPSTMFVPSFTAAAFNPVAAVVAAEEIIAAVVFLFTAALTCVTGGTVDATATVGTGGAAVFASWFIAATASAGTTGNTSAALLVTFTSTPNPALTHG